MQWATIPRFIEGTRMLLRRESFEPLSVGRVEDRRGSLGPMANAPFPIPAHRTGVCHALPPYAVWRGSRGEVLGSDDE